MSPGTAFATHSTRRRSSMMFRAQLPTLSRSACRLTHARLRRPTPLPKLQPMRPLGRFARLLWMFAGR
jgi:hypothetical protein